jgi:arabinofuranan 3-O-arabinosyltransferase
MTSVDSPRSGLRDWAQDAFGPRIAAPSTATVLRSVLWPVAILAVIHRTIVVTTNGNITDDFKPVYRAVLNFRHGWDIYNEHFDYVDPHYLYPPGGTLIMARSRAICSSRSTAPPSSWRRTCYCGCSTSA